jgi:glycosyltransferase involved in cell wall biosynthesis
MASLRRVEPRRAETLTIFFPMWNEEAYIERTVGAAKEVADELLAAGSIADYELVVVDDASTDLTPKIADEMAAADPRVKVVHHPVNRKLGGSIKTGFASATGDLVLYTDADLPSTWPSCTRPSACCATTRPTS